MPDNPAKTRYLPISYNRALVLDGLHFARQVPLFPVERTFDLREVSRLRSNQARRISWSILFLKAYAIVARDYSPLRQAYLSWPWPCLIEAPHSVGMIALNRECHGEDRICWGRFDEPENQRLTVLQRELERYQSSPVDEVFTRQVRLSRMPGWLRRGLLWWNLYFAGSRRARRLGTFSLSTLAGHGALNRGHPTFLTSSLTYGPLDERGQCVVTLLCDHRVIDGVMAARALGDLQATLCGPITAELASGVVAKAA
jgi:hypothetical protein